MVRTKLVSNNTEKSVELQRGIRVGLHWVERSQCVVTCGLVVNGVRRWVIRKNRWMENTWREMKNYWLTEHGRIIMTIPLGLTCAKRHICKNIYQLPMCPIRQNNVQNPMQNQINAKLANSVHFTAYPNKSRFF